MAGLPASTELLRFPVWSLHGRPIADHTSQVLAHARHLDARARSRVLVSIAVGVMTKTIAHSPVAIIATSMNLLLSTGDNRPVHASSDGAFGGSTQSTTALSLWRNSSTGVIRTPNPDRTDRCPHPAAEVMMVGIPSGASETPEAIVHTAVYLASERPRSYTAARSSGRTTLAVIAS
jgi:hypothetical protein